MTSCVGRPRTDIGPNAQRRAANAGTQRSSDKQGRHHLGLTRHRFGLDSRDKFGRKVRGQTLNDVE